MEDGNEGEIVRELPEPKKPKPVLKERFLKYLIVYEFFDSGAFNGFTTVFAIFISETILLRENGVREIVHYFFFAVYMAFILGSITSDGCLGNYYSSLIFSLLQVVGYSLMALATTYAPEIKLLASSAGLFVLILLAATCIAVGSGAAKTAFYTFGCDQAMLSLEMKAEGGEASRESESLLSTAQNLTTEYFIAAVFVGSKSGQILYNSITPEVRVYRAGSYISVFLLLAATKAVSTVALWCGRYDYHYKKTEYDPRLRELEQKERQRRKKLRETGKFLADETAPLIDQRVERTRESQDRTWEDRKVLLLAVLTLLPLLFYKALTSETATSWVLQAQHMNGHVIANWTILPHQMATFSSILFLLCIPLLVMVIYPLVNKYIIELTSLRKLSGSLTLATIAFVCCGFLQIALESRLHRITAEHANVSILWQIPQYVLLAFGEASYGIAVVDFAYHEAPKSMKASVNGVIHAILGSGNLITVAALAILGPDVSNVEKNFACAGLGGVGIILLAFLSYFYVTRQERESKQKDPLSLA